MSLFVEASLCILFFAPHNFPIAVTVEAHRAPSLIFFAPKKDFFYGTMSDVPQIMERQKLGIIKYLTFLDM